jgi:hypothetical protein
MGRETLIFLLVLALVSLWMYRNGGTGFWGAQMSTGIPIPRTVTPVEIHEAPASPPVTVVAEPPVTVAAQPPPVVIPPREEIIVDPQPQVTVARHSDIMGYAQVLSDSLNLRSGPGSQFYVINVLPRFLTIGVLRQMHIGNDGEPWVEVIIDTDQGPQRGWVDRRYLSSCHCPTY